MNKILITGGAGFIGYHLAKRFSLENCQIDLIDDLSRGVIDSSLNKLLGRDNVNLLNGDLTSSKIIKDIKDDYDYIFHLAAVIGVKHVIEKPYETLEKNLILLKNSIQVAKKQKSLKNFLFTSSSEVYAGTLNLYGLSFPTPEKSPLNLGDLSDKRNCYMLSKIYGEAMCLHSKLPVIIIRPHNFYGPRMGLSHVIPELLKKAHENTDGELEVYSVDHKRTFIFINDAIEIIFLLLKNSNLKEKIFNIGNPKPEVSIKELANMVIKISNKNLRINPLQIHQGSPTRRCPDVSKVIKATSYESKFKLEDGLIKTYDWYKEYIFSSKDVSSI